MQFTTADLCDRYLDSGHLQILEPIFKVFGGQPIFSGQISTLKVFEDDALLAKTLSEPVQGRVLVVDGGGSHRCALLDESLAAQAIANGWQGIVVYGCVRHSHGLQQLPFGIRALHAHPQGAHKRGGGDRDTQISFAGAHFRKDHFLYADSDGIIVSETMLR